MEEDINNMIQENGGLPSDNDDNEDGGAPAIDFPKLIKESGLFRSMNGAEDKEIPATPAGKDKKEKGKTASEIAEMLEVDIEVVDEILNGIK
jgi:hypothetical protein